MLLVTTNRRLWLIGVAASFAIFLIMYFTVIRPDNNAANQAIRTGLQQSQQALNQAAKTEQGAAGQAGAAGGAQLSKAAKLTACVAAAGTNPTKLTACQTKYAG
jgi:hypothetical protein